MQWTVNVVKKWLFLISDKSVLPVTDLYGQDNMNQLWSIQWTILFQNTFGVKTQETLSGFHAAKEEFSMKGSSPLIYTWMKQFVRHSSKRITISFFNNSVWLNQNPLNWLIIQTRTNDNCLAIFRLSSYCPHSLHFDNKNWEYNTFQTLNNHPLDHICFVATNNKSLCCQQSTNETKESWLWKKNCGLTCMAMKNMKKK